MMIQDTNDMMNDAHKRIARHVREESEERCYPKKSRYCAAYGHSTHIP